MFENGRKRVVIENVSPEIDSGRFPIKRVTGEPVSVSADIFADGHDLVRAHILFKKKGDAIWTAVKMRHAGGDRWAGSFAAGSIGAYLYTIEGWVDHFASWQADLKKKFNAGQDIKTDLLIGAGIVAIAAKRTSGDEMERLFEIAELVETEPNEKAFSISMGFELSELMERHGERRFPSRYDRELPLTVDREKALFSAWYERFPRSCAPGGGHGTFKDCELILPEIAKMGFDVLYFPPIHPIGKTSRKGKNNSRTASPGDPGSPWAIGSFDGGHRDIEKELGTIDDFKNLAAKAVSYGIEIALDLSFQCSPDHPYVKARPEWFRWRPGGSIQFAENPPKKYEDVIPFNFESDKYRELWEELKGIVLFWIDKGVKIFRVDNPHTKPFAFWEWLIAEVKGAHPEVIFLSEAFTRPKVMYRLAKAGFSQSYTYFTWRNTKKEIMDYLRDITKEGTADFFRPSFWPNTPDILPGFLQYGGRPAFMSRLVLAATLSSNYGIYGPAYELCADNALDEKEEYLDSEKYEIKNWGWDAPDNIKGFIADLNRIRKENPALHSTRNLEFYEIENDFLLAYGKTTEDLSNVILTAVNIDPHHTQSGWVKVPVERLGIPVGQPYLADDLLSGRKYVWNGQWNYIELNPHESPAHIFRLRKRLRRETDFDYFM